MRLQERRDLAEHFKQAAGLPDPERYPTSQSDLQYCPGRSCGKEWPEFSAPFNARLGRGLSAEDHWRKFFPVIGFPSDAPEKVTLDGIEGHPDGLNDEAILEFKTTDFTDTKAAMPPQYIWQAKSYCKMFDRYKVVFVVLYNRANKGDGELVITEIEFSDEELDKHWLEALGRVQLTDDARAWARTSGGPQVIPAEFRKPHYPWECFNSKGEPTCFLARARLCPGKRK